MFSFDKVAIVGDFDLLLPFKALGWKVFSAKNREEAKRALGIIEKEKYALCFLHESFLEPLREEREALERKFCPVVVGFSDYSKVTDYLKVMVKDLAIKATGSDSLVRRKG